MIDALGDALGVFQKQMNDISKGMFDGLIPALKRIDKRYWAILPYLKETGFVLSPNSPMSLLMDIEELVNAGTATPENVCKVIVKLSEEDDFALLKEMLMDWRDENYFSKRSELLDDALEAHINGKYSLSIPAMMPLIEGFFHSVRGRFKGGDLSSSG